MAEDFGSSSPAAEAAELNDVMAALALRTADLEASANSFARAMTSAFSRAIVSGQDFDDLLQSLALRLSDLALRMAFRPLERGLAGGLEQLFGGFFGGTSASSSASPAPAGSSATNLSGPATAAEASARRVAPAIAVHIATPDAESFRRSETYVAGLIARAVARGQRGL